jgi:hypothetical protein
MKIRSLKISIIGLIILAIVLGGYFVWFSWKDGSVMVQSASPHGGVIKVRAVPSLSSPISMFTSDSRFYRCEYYWGLGQPLFSCQSYSEDSYIAQSVKIEWNTGSSATVSFDGRPTLRCIDGRWESIK